MKHAARLIAAVLSWILLFNLAACGDPGTDPEPGTQPTEPAVSATEVYNAAKAMLLSAPNRILNYTITKTRTVAGQAYTEASEGVASFSDVGTEEMIAVIKEDLDYGSLSANHILSFCNGRAYSRISGSTFGADMTAEAFMATQLPVALLSTSAYNSVVRTLTADGFMISFNNPMALETWLNAPADATIDSAYGIAHLDKDGVLIQTDYYAQYTCGNVVFTVVATLKCSTPVQLELSALHPEHPEDYAMLSCLEAPKLLLRAAGDIFSSKAISAVAEETIYSQIIPLTRQRKCQMEISGTSDALSAQLSNVITIKDYRDQASTTTQAYIFANGSCFLSTDGGDPTAQPGINASGMRTSIEDTLLSALFATRYLSGATMTDQDDVYRLDFSGNEAYCSDLTRDLSAFLNLPTEGITSHHSTQASGYLCIDKLTGLPVAMGMHFTRTHMFGDIPYVLSYQLDQVLILSPAE